MPLRAFQLAVQFAFCILMGKYLKIHLLSGRLIQHPLRLGIIIGITIPQLKRWPVRDLHRCPFGRIYRKIFKAPCQNPLRLSPSNGKGQSGHPHILLVHRVGQPHRVLRTVHPLRNAPHVLGPEILPEAAEPHGRHLPMHQHHIAKSNSVIGKGDAQGPSVCGFQRRVIKHGISAVGRTLGPNLLTAHNQRRGYSHRTPCSSPVVASGAPGMLPQPNDGLLPYMIPAECLIGGALRIMLDPNDLVFVSVLLRPLLHRQRIPQKLLTAFHESCVRRLRI